jgi:N-carbamoylputrescine amidase
MKFWGGSFVSNPFGKLLHLSSHDQEEVSVIALDLDKTDRYRTHWPFLRDRRIDKVSQSGNGTMHKNDVLSFYSVTVC